MDTQDHDQQPNGDDDQQCKAEPSQHHRACTNTTPDTAVSEVLSYLRRSDRGGVLPKNADENEDRGDEDQRQSHLRDRPRREGFDVNVGPGAGVVFFVPAWERGEEEEGDEGEDDGDDAVEEPLSATVL